MRQAATFALAVGIFVGTGLAGWAQALPAVAAPAAAVAGGLLHGTVRSGKIPLPGVTVSALNTLSGKRYSTTTDINGAWSLRIPQDGRYVLRTEFAAFAQGVQEALLKAGQRDQTVNFDLILASRAAALQQQEALRQNQQGSGGQNVEQLAGSGAESLSLMSALSQGTDTGSGVAGESGAALPSIAGNADFSSDSVAITGQSGQVSPMAGGDMDHLRDAMEAYRAQHGGQFPGGGGLLGGSGFGGPGGFGGLGGFGGGRGNFRGFNPGQPHGAIFWDGSNSALNAQPFALRGQSQQQPASGTNRFGLTLMSAPYLPGLTKPSGKDTVFLSLSGQRSSNPSDQYATVPTDAERSGDFSAAGLPAIYNPANFQQFSYNGTPNVIPPQEIVAQAVSLLSYFPEPNLPGTVQNYHLLTTAQSNQTQAGVRYMRSLGANAAQPGGFGRFGGFGRRSQDQSLHQSMSFNYNWSHSASDLINIFPQLGGKSATGSYSLQAGYVVGVHRFNSISNVNWNRSNSQVRNFFTNGTDIATQLGILGPGGTALNASPLNYGLPNVTLSTITGLNQQQPDDSLTQTIAVSEVVAWMHGKHNFRFGGDYRRVHRDFLAGANATGSFTFTGLFTEDQAGDAATGSPLADLLLGLPQATSIDSSVAKSYLRDNTLDAFFMDDWRVLPQLTLNYGVRYEYYAPYTEKYGHLAVVDTNPAENFTQQAEVQSGGVGPFSGHLPNSLVFPWHKAFAPRVGLALRLPKQTVLRAGFGMNYTVGEYATFATDMAHEPPFANEQTNEEVSGNTPSSACARTAPAQCFTLANGFPAPAAIGDYALYPHYPLPYVQAWNIDVQKTLPWGIVMNLGYNGSKGNHLDVRSAPRATPSSPGTDPANRVFDYDQALAFSKFGAGTVRAYKRLSGGVSLGAYYQYSHSIDDASSVNGTSTVVAQNWQNLNAEEGNSSFDVRHKVSGTYLYELPFGSDKRWITTGPGAHLVEGLSVSGSFTFASGTPLSPAYTATVASVACGTAGSLRPNRVPGVSVTAGGGGLKEWFNPAAYSEPAATPGYCNAFGNAARNSIEGPGTVSNDMALSKTMQLGDTRSMEIRAMLNNAFNTVQYTGVDTNVASPSFGQVTSVGKMRSFQFMARFRF